MGCSNAGGGRAVKYGVTGRYVMGLEVVTPTGDIVHLGGKVMKDVTGYDLIHLMVGSEGVLDYLPMVLEPQHMEMIRVIKKALDPNLILNPGKII